MTRATADLYDIYGESLRIAAPIFRDFGGRSIFEGRVATVKVHEDNSVVRATLEQAGVGRVLVVDGGGSLRCALVGDVLGDLGVRNDWRGIVVYGCIRDAASLSQLPIGLKALATNPRKSNKNGVGDIDVPVQFADIQIEPGDYLYADGDGIVVADRELI